MSNMILVVDDDVTMVRAIYSILKNEYEVYMVNSGKNALDFLNIHIPDLVLLDIKMPVMDGFETLSKMREHPGMEEVPVIFLTGSDDVDSEERGLEVGASDFIRKPVLPKILRLRVRHMIELYTLRNDLKNEVERQTSKIKEQQNKLKQMTFQITEALAGAIDAKDTYTSGHSKRVATYAREIAMRYCYSVEMQENVFITGMLHDVGKIGIPNAIINKPGRLTDEEFKVIKTHPAIGAEILEKITAIPFIAIGAHWHHERYDGRGYPDGLAGDAIPEIARIIGVADAYDAMSSKRSYRDPLPQDVVRAEIEKGRGSQFDPRFADIMLAMIDGDTGYQMREL
ncbi:MAG: response regulator [Lachnospiraceae bacterium]|nr:response regulator [Lachnospiraceae bacterium]